MTSAPLGQSVLDNRLALGQFIDRAERCGINWMLNYSGGIRTPEYRYELRIYDEPARGIYRGATASHAASKAQAALDEHRIGWED